MGYNGKYTVHDLKGTVYPSAPSLMSMFFILIFMNRETLVPYSPQVQRDSREKIPDEIIDTNQPKLSFHSRPELQHW